MSMVMLIGHINGLVKGHVNSHFNGHVSGQGKGLVNGLAITVLKNYLFMTVSHVLILLEFNFGPKGLFGLICWFATCKQ